ncbi:MAG: histidine phosphatase family protein [Dactylosporangium sp.]|nr:histidine phosphatase family protein [Dactylosporangium sp.]NNJ61360.1 histidine phosphatase family protein [Dactylosporangium sp.]
MKRLLVWRHGQTLWNAGGRVQGHADIGLTDLGRRQAERAAQRLAVLGPTAIVSSDLSRAADTAAALATVTGLDVRLDARLRERYYGPWQGLTGDEIGDRWPEEHTRWKARASDIGLDIESLDDLAKRASGGFLDAAVSGEVTVLVTHGGTARQGCGAVLGWPDQVIRTLSGLGNCHWTELRSDSVRGWRLWSHNVG